MAAGNSTAHLYTVSTDVRGAIMCTMSDTAAWVRTLPQLADFLMLDVERTKI